MLALVEIFNEDGNVYVFHKLFTNISLAEKYVKQQKELYLLRKAAQQRYNEIISQFPSFSFSEPEPPKVKPWKAGLSAKDITTEMKQERDAVKQLHIAYQQRWSHAYNEYHVKRNAYISKIWAEEKQTIPYETVLRQLRSIDYEIREVNVHGTLE